jgi:hypothetical protein
MNIKFLFLFLTEVNAYQIPKINKFNNINLKKIPDYHNVHYYDKNITLVPYYENQNSKITPICNILYCMMIYLKIACKSAFTFIKRK